MEFRILGAIEAGSGGTVVDLGPPKQRALLAILLLHVGQIVPVERLIDLLWDDDPPRTADHSVQIYVSELRKALEPVSGSRLIHRRPPGYQLDVPTESVDANRFEALVQDGSRLLAAGDRDKAIGLLRSALALWRGPALSDFTYDEFAQPYLRRLNDLHLDAIETLASAEIEAGTPASAIPLLEAAIGDDPLRERSRELLMLALYRTGRHPEALRTYDRLRTLLVEELGLEPSPPLQQLRDRILLHDPTLLPVGAPEPGAAARNPYKGLQPFTERDAPDFFGREALAEHLLAPLQDGRRFVALVGPSGSGKSSVVAAGLVPRLRAGGVPGSENWIIASVALGPDPIAEVRGVLQRIGPPASRAAGPLPLPVLKPGARLVLVLDQFEQVFNISDPQRRGEFLSALATELRKDPGELMVVAALRADFYDRPLQVPEISDVFVQGVVHVLPMTARELETAIEGPAERVGVQIEPGLLAELVAETATQPGSLPLLQYALTELFERRSGQVLTHASYAALGGLRGVLTRRAEAAFLELDADQQRIASQVFLRLVQPGRGAADSRRRITVAELTDLATDSVALSVVVTAFGRHRLLSFDRDPATGQATVELAHEALLAEWERLSGWIDRHRAALRRRDALLNAVDEWELADRHPDYLLTGTRLDEFASWSSEGSLQLTGREQRFLDAGLERRRRQEAEAAEAELSQRRLARSARLRLAGMAIAVLLLGGAALFAFLAAPPQPLAPVVYFWTDESVINRLIVSGFDRAVADFELLSRKFSWDDSEARLIEQYGEAWWEGRSDEENRELWFRNVEGHVREVVEDGAGLVYVFGLLAKEVDRIAADYPDTVFVAAQGARQQPNVVYLNPNDAEPAYLAGAAAALKTESGIVGFIGGVPVAGVWGFQAGFEAGVRATNPDVEVVVEYLSTDDPGAFGDFELARDSALELYGSGADIIFHAAGDAGLGVFEAASQFSEAESRHVWAIGVDSDQYWTVLRLPGVDDPEGWQAHILTSVLKPFAPMAYEVVKAYAERDLQPGEWIWGLEETGGEGISYSGGHLEDLRPRLEALREQIMAGAIRVPCVPDELLARAEQLGIGPDDCHGG